MQQTEKTILEYKLRKEKKRDFVRAMYVYDEKQVVRHLMDVGIIRRKQPWEY